MERKAIASHTSDRGALRPRQISPTHRETPRRVAGPRPQALPLEAVTRMRRPLALALALTAFGLAGCVGQYRGEPEMWFATHGGTPPTASRVVVCHAFGCARRDSVAFGAKDLASIRKILAAGKASPEAERAAIARYVAWAEKRVAPIVGSQDDIGGLDLWNAGRPGQMDCIDEATNTTSYLLFAERNGLLVHHRVANAVARGFFLDGRYPHATAVVTEKRSGTAFAVDSWTKGNGAPPVIMPLQAWFDESPSGGRFGGLFTPAGL